jgi:hypothetical protein
MQEHKKQHYNRLVETRAKTAQEERDSLRLALKLHMQDRASKQVILLSWLMTETSKAVAGNL